jgi:hypothetical protein
VGISSLSLKQKCLWSQDLEKLKNQFFRILLWQSFLTLLKPGAGKLKAFKAKERHSIFITNRRANQR